MKNVRFALLFLGWSAGLMAQKSQVQSAWRALSDYEELRKENPQSPEIKYLNKAKEAIDKALLSEETKNQTKTHAYKLRISYALYQYNLNEEIKRQEAAGVQDKLKRYNLAYGKTSITEFNEANVELGIIKDLDPKFIEKIQVSLAKNDAASLDDEELKFALAVQEMKQEAPNIAIGKYETKEYELSAEFFYRAAFMNSVLYKELDTANFYNACVAAAKSGNPDKVIEYNKKMLDAKIGVPYNYVSLSKAYQTKGDTAEALSTLQKGRKVYPTDPELLSEETNIYLTSNQELALKNLTKALEKDSTNALYCFLVGTIYDGMANPKDRNTGKDLPKPKDFEDLIRKAEWYYIRSVSVPKSDEKVYLINGEIYYIKSAVLNKEEIEPLFNSYFNLGALYNNYAIYIENKGIDKITDMSKMQKENATKSLEFYKKAIPYLEKAHKLKPDDKDTMKALRQLYYRTDNTKMAKEMDERLKN